LCFRNHQNDVSSLSNDKIYKIVFDKEGMLWVGTEDGANVFDTHTKKAFRIVNSTASYQNYRSDFVGHSVREIYIDHNGLYWLSTFQEVSINMMQIWRSLTINHIIHLMFTV
jgi:ligand-binding sensor domain-containing protein